MNLCKADLLNIYIYIYIYGLQLPYEQFSGIQLLILDLTASTDSNLFKLFGSSSHILGAKYAKEFNP